MKPSTRINEIYTYKAEAERVTGQEAMFIPGAAERIVSSIIQYLDEQAEKESKLK